MTDGIVPETGFKVVSTDTPPPAAETGPLDTISRLVTLAESIGKPGNQTTEYKLTAALTIVSTVIAGLAQFAAYLHAAYPNAQWLASAVEIVALLTTVLGILGYGSGRRAMKGGLTDLIQEISSLHQHSLEQTVKLQLATATDAPRESVQLPDGRHVVAVGAESIGILKAHVADMQDAAVLNHPAVQAAFALSKPPGA